MRLHFAPRSRAVRARWILEELETPYELVKVDPAHAPVLVDHDATLTESAAICLYLAEAKLAPAPLSPDRGAYLQWLIFAETTLDAAVIEVLGNPNAPRARADAALNQLDAWLGDREHVAGPRFTAADIVTASVLHLAHNLKLLDGRTRLYDYMMRHVKRPAARRAVS